MTTNEPAPDFPEVLTTAMAAELLHVHVEYLRRMVREGRIPAHRFPEGRELRFLRDELITWVGPVGGSDRSDVAIQSGSSGGASSVSRDRTTSMLGQLARMSSNC